MDKQSNRDKLGVGYALVTSEGLRFRGRRYSCRRALREGWFERAHREGPWRLPMVYSPAYRQLFASCGEGEDEPCRAVEASTYPADLQEWYESEFSKLKERYREARIPGSRP